MRMLKATGSARGRTGNWKIRVASVDSVAVRVSDQGTRLMTTVNRFYRGCQIEYIGIIEDFVKSFLKQPWWFKRDQVWI
jgi:hypothetical protein